MFSGIDKEVAQGVDGVVVLAVFVGKLGCIVVGVVITFESFYKFGAVGRNYERTFAAAVAKGAADEFDAFEDAAFAVAAVDAEFSQFADGT